MVEDGLSTHRSFTGRSRSPRVSPKWNLDGLTCVWVISFGLFHYLWTRGRRGIFSTCGSTDRV